MSPTAKSPPACRSTTLSRPSTMNGNILRPLPRKVTACPCESIRSTSAKNKSLPISSSSVIVCIVILYFIPHRRHGGK